MEAVVVRGKWRITLMRFLCIIPLLALCDGCVSKLQDKISPARELSSVGNEHVTGVWLLRHKVRLEIPQIGFAQSFDGLMRLDAANRTIRVTALGGLGLQLFDMQIGPDWMRTAYLNPVMEKIPYITERIASCIQRIWFDSFGIMRQSINFHNDEWSVWVDEKKPENPWAFHILFVDSRIGYTVTVRLLHVQREDIP